MLISFLKTNSSFSRALESHTRTFDFTWRTWNLMPSKVATFAIQTNANASNK
jgi:hypothetical protein